MIPSPPHDESAEAAVIGAVLLAEGWLRSTEVSGLTAEDFYRPRHRVLWDAIKRAEGAVDPLTIAADLEAHGELTDAGGKDYIESLVTRIPAIGNTKQYAQIVKEKADLRQVLLAGQELERWVYEHEGSAKELVEKGLALVGNIGARTQDRAYSPDDLLQLAVDHFDPKTDHEVFKLPLPELNEACNGGLRRGQVMALAAFPNVGKSAFGMDCLESAIAGTDRKARIYLTEMTVQEINHRIIARQTSLTVNEVIRGNLDLDQYRELNKLKMPNIEIQPAAGWTADQIAQDILRRRPDIVLIDHFHRIKFPSGRNKIEAMDEASALLNSVAKDNHANCVILLVAHLSRPNTEREAAEPRPTGRHLRGTQMLEADADIVCMIHRDRDRQSMKRLAEAEIYFIRNRQGDADASAKAKFDWRNLRFVGTGGEAKF